jgi:hypothetical protein
MLPPAAFGDDYLGVLKPSRAGVTAPAGSLTLASEPVNMFVPVAGADPGVRMRLGYRYSRFFSVEGQFVDFGHAPGDSIFAGPGNLASAFRSTGFGVDTVATLPAWRGLSFYGRMGAYRGDVRNPFAAYSTSLLGGSTPAGTRLRYGLGMRYDFTRALGIHAEFERYSPLGSPLSGDIEADQISIGLMWRF